MNDARDLPEQVAQLIESVSHASSAAVAILNEALLDFVFALYIENSLNRSEYGALVHALDAAFWDNACSLQPPFVSTKEVVERAEEAAGLARRVRALCEDEHSIEVECDIGAFVHHVQREVKHGMAEKIELDFYVHWFEPVLFGRNS